LLKKAPFRAIFPQNPQPGRNFQTRLPEKAFPEASYGNHLLIAHPYILIQLGFLFAGSLIGFFLLVTGETGMFRQRTTLGSRAK